MKCPTCGEEAEETTVLADCGVRTFRCDRHGPIVTVTRGVPINIDDFVTEVEATEPRSPKP